MEMQERGRLIRTELANAVRERIPSLQAAFDPLFDDLAVEGSDGIGRKTEAPWVRFFSRAMSPNPREGFYFVIHFAADGSAVFFTVGCGSTIWSGEDLRLISDLELQKRTTWARGVIEQRWGTLNPFVDEIVLGAKAPLPRQFERATAIAKRLSVEELSRADLDQILYDGCERLSAIYLAQLAGRDLSPGEQDAEEITLIAKPLRARRRSQGIGLTGAQRKAVEMRAMNLAKAYLVELGYECVDTSATKPYDLIAKKQSVNLKIEVKGTTSDICDSVLMTRNEVDLHREERGKTGLIIVSRIELNRDGDNPSATGGTVEALLQWDIDEWTAKPVAFEIRRDKR